MLNLTLMDGFKNKLLEKIKNLTEKDREIFDRIFTVWETKGHLNPPKEMEDWIKENFSKVENVVDQDFLKITNKITYEGAIFNELRTMRPVINDGNLDEIFEVINSSSNGPFSKPLTQTPEDVFGRIKGKFCITASNVAKYDGMHGLIIFDNHNPLHFKKDRVRDYFDVARKWFAKAFEAQPKAVYPLFTWNCLWKAGASVIHSHSQLALTEGMAYARIEEHRSLTLKYQEEYRTNYFDDLFYLHDLFGLALEKNGIRIVSKLTPFKEKELEIYTTSFDDNLADTVNDILNTYKEDLGVVSFNVAIILPPMTKTYEVWTHMPVIIKLVDRGSLSSKTADIGSMEIYAQSVIGSNPYFVYEKLKAKLNP